MAYIIIPGLNFTCTRFISRERLEEESWKWGKREAADLKKGEEKMFKKKKAGRTGMKEKRIHKHEKEEEKESLTGFDAYEWMLSLGLSKSCKMIQAFAWQY